MAKLPPKTDPQLLVGIETGDDAGVYRLSDETALVMTVDYITPPVDDPFLFGQIAAANALSDVYAMGGKPLACLNLVGFPSQELPQADLEQIMAGALSKIEEAGAVLAGGHSTDDEEPKFGLSVTGLVHPDKIWLNSGAREGDVLILTKPLGSGVLINAQRKGLVGKEEMDACVETIIKLNKDAAEVMAAYPIHSCTDVTGFGLAGHSFNAARGAGLTFQIEMEKLPLMAGALEMYEKGVTTRANKANRELVTGSFRFETPLPDWHKEIVFDPQTSGGLLFALPPDSAEAILKDLHAAGVQQAVKIGQVTAQENDYLVFL